MEINIEIDYSIQHPLNQAYFDLEWQNFKNIKGCPQDYNEYLQFYKRKDFIVCSCYDIDELVGYKISEKITDKHYHQFIIVVSERYRGIGLAKKISDRLNYELKEKGVEYLTSFSLPQSKYLEMEDKYYQKISNSGILTSEEIIAMKNIEKVRNIKLERSRIQINYYKFYDGNEYDAVFKVYKLKE